MKTKKLTPEKIVEDVVNKRISKEVAVAAIRELIKETQKDCIGTMGDEEYKYYTELCKEINKNLNSPLGNSKGKIDAIIQKAVEFCGYTDFYSIENTNDNQWKLRNTIVKNTHLFFKPAKQKTKGEKFSKTASSTEKSEI